MVVPDYGGINLILSVLENSLLCGLLFVSSLLQLYLDREGGVRSALWPYRRLTTADEKVDKTELTEWRPPPTCSVLLISPSSMLV